MLSSETETPINGTNEPKPKKEKSNLLRILIIIGVSLILIFMFVPGLKEQVYHLGKKIKSWGPYGPFILVPLCGFIAIPLGLPFMIFEMTNALIADKFYVAVIISMLSKFLGGTICFLLGKYKFRQKILDSLEDSKIYQGIDKLIDHDPLKISCMIRMTNLPLFLKSYGLLLSEKVTFFIYTFANLSTGILSSIIEINIYRQAKNLKDLMANGSTHQKVYSIISLVFSIGVFIYIVIYTRKIVKMLENQTKDREKRPGTNPLEVSLADASKVQLTEPQQTEAALMGGEEEEDPIPEA